MRRLLVVLVLIVIIVIGLWWLWPEPVPVSVTPPAPVVTSPRTTVIGRSVEGRAIEAVTYGTGAKKLLFIGAIHGGYEWNSALLAYQLIDYLKANPSTVPASLSVTIIPVANPDGVYQIIGKEGPFTLADVPTSTPAVAGSGRFNAHSVDLNRNWDCKWQPTSTWRSQTVSAGTAPFSEPETAALRDWVLQNKPAAIVSWHSQANAVYASECEQGILPETLTILDLYAKAANYRAVKSFDAYPVSGDAESWFAKQNIPALTVELATHETVEWEKNLAGVKALLGYYGGAIMTTFNN